jgi:hypothetical protein
VLAAELPNAPMVQSMLAELRQARATVVRLGLVTRWLAQNGVPLPDHLGETVYQPPLHWPAEIQAQTLDPRWDAALLALQGDAGAPSLG